MKLNITKSVFKSSPRHLSTLIILSIFLITIITAFTLPSPQAIAQDNKKPSITPTINLEPTASGTPRKLITEKTKQDARFADIAKDKVSKKLNIAKEKLKVANAKDAVFRFSGKKSHDVKLTDSSGKIYKISLDDDDNEIDFEAMAKEDREIKIAKYGKFTPDFYERLSKEKEDTSVKALIVVESPNVKPLPRPDTKFPDNTNNPALEELDAITKREKDMQDAAFKPILETTIEKFKTKGYDFIDNTTGVFIADITARDLKEIEKWDEIKQISDGSGKLEDFLASAGAASGVTAVNSRNINGSGVIIGVIEANGRYSRNTTITPDLPLANITQDTTYVCPTPGDHATQVVGVLKSTNTLNSGVAQGASLWVSGACGGDKDQMIDRAQYSVNSTGVKVVNLSAGCTVEGDSSCYRYPDAYAAKYDELIWSKYASVVAGAGNGNNDRKIMGFQTAYNLLTIGNYDDWNNNDPSDDIMSADSSYVNPISYHNDREKPEVVAPGKFVTSTGYTAPLIEASGTSFSAPVVSGGLAALMQRYPNFKAEPEALKALVIATARNNIKGNNIPYDWEDSEDGYGAVDFDLADKVLTGQARGSQEAHDYRCGDGAYNIPINVTNTNPHRIVVTWRVNPTYIDYSNRPNVDLDIEVRDASGNWVGGSYSYDNNVEATIFWPSITGTYTASIYAGCEPLWPDTRFALAWSEVPNPFTAQYFNNTTLSGTPAVTRKDPKIGFDWGTDSPDGAINSDNFSARWTKTENFTAGTYTFTATGDDGIRLYVDNVLIIDKWFDQGPTTYTATRTLTAGNHTIKFEYYDSGGGAVARMGYERMTPIVSGGVYKLVNQCSGKVLDVDGGKTNDGANVQIWSWANVGQQRWKTESLTGGYYKLIPQHATSKVLEIWGNLLNDFADADIWGWNGGNNQQWSIVNGGIGFSKILARHSGKALDVDQASVLNGAGVQQFFDNHSCAQRWQLIKL